MDNKCIVPLSEKCCGCGACKTVCSVNAISMEENEYGFVMPVVNHEKCIDCGKCSRVCAFSDSQKYISKDFPIKSFAAVLKDDTVLEKSTSGGAFAGVAGYILDEGGIVFGAAMDKNFDVKHVGIDSKSKLHYLQGSKYTQSDTTDVFGKVKIRLEEQRKVLFSGTPCQVAALRSFLGKEYDNLFTIDLVCHGVGSNKMFKEDIEYLSHKYKSEIKSVSFRSKRRGWGTSGDLVLEKRIIDYNPSTSPYYYYYIENSIFRESCYHCPYAIEKRVGDITVGDFWRIETLFKDLTIDTFMGASCLMINNEKGLELANLVKSDLILVDTDYDEIVARNGNLSRPSIPKNRNVMELYLKRYSELADYYYKTAKLYRIKQKVRSLVPFKIKRFIKRMLNLK